MAEPVSEVRISTRLDNSKLNNDFRGTADKMKQLSNEFKNTNKFILDTQKELDKTRQSLDDLTAKKREPEDLKAMSAELKTVQAETKAIEKENADLIASYEKAVQQVEQLRETGFNEDQLTPYIEEVDRLAERLYPVWEQLDAGEKKSKELAASMEQIRLNPETSKEAQDLNTRIDALGNELDNAKDHANELRKNIDFRQAIEAFRLAGVKATELSRKIASIGVSAAKGLGTLVSYASQGVKSIAGMVAGLIQVNRRSRQASNGIHRLGNRLLRLAKNVFVFSLITSGLREIRQGIADLMKTNSQMAASLNAIQVNLLVAFAPLWEYIQPGLITFLSVLEYATAAVATFFAMLGGKTYEQAKAAAQALYEQIKALRETGKEADKAGRKLAGFDKINKLAQETTEEGSGLDFGAVELPDFSWLDELRSIIGDWYKVGEFLSGKLTNFLMGIDWSRIKEGARKLATNIVNFINGFLDDPALWIALGRTIAEGLNTALTFLNTLLSGLHWETFGRNFGMMLNKVVSDFDWVLLGRTLGNYFNAVLGFLLRAVQTFDWAYLGAMLAAGLLSMTNTINWDYIALLLSGGLNGALLTLFTFLTSYPWGDLGATLANSLNLMVTTIDWPAIGATIAALFNSAISFLYRVVTDFRWAELGLGLAQAISKLFNDIQWAELGRTLSNFFIGVLDFIMVAVTEMDWFAIGKAIGEFFANIDWKTVFEKVGQIIGLTLGGIFATIWAALGADAEDVEKAFRGLVEWLERNRETIGKVVAAAALLITTLGVLSPLVNAAAALFKFLASPIALATVAVATLTAGILSLYNNWDKLTPAQRTITMLGALVAAALAAALAIGIFHTSWTAGLAAAAIAAGIALLVGVSAFKGVNIKNPVSSNALSGVEYGSVSMPASATSFYGTISRGSPLPKLAKGGIVDQATVAMIGERGKEAVLPLNASTMRMLAQEIVGEMDISRGGSQQQSINIIADGDVGQLIRFFKFELDREDRRKGNSMGSRMAPQW